MRRIPTSDRIWNYLLHNRLISMYLQRILLLVIHCHLYSFLSMSHLIVSFSSRVSTYFINRCCNTHDLKPLWIPLRDFWGYWSVSFILLIGLEIECKTLNCGFWRKFAYGVERLILSLLICPWAWLGRNLLYSVSSYFKMFLPSWLYIVLYDVTFTRSF